MHQQQQQASRQALAQHGPGRNQFKSLNLSKRSLEQKKKLKNQLKMSKLRTKLKTKLAQQLDLESSSKSLPEPKPKKRPAEKKPRKVEVKNEDTLSDGEICK